jgi:hypothetical protein
MKFSLTTSLLNTPFSPHQKKKERKNTQIMKLFPLILSRTPLQFGREMEALVVYPFSRTQ